ncbi:hypothetical protein [Actinoplanes sp. NBRC 103695]|uniref:WD40 repeat domain-containing protein n=1 Tax=Actinoplanes sp. NBRC 103695 TaxID=3032202 RepID=UPI0024A26ABA|nr:hypothetical protein [Actinoplanes sp. NBRC 103695]GLZ02466.1 hypothetical protein Acsp02_97170 [Actinoplanes sp. NBRC 103695]
MTVCLSTQFVPFASPPEIGRLQLVQTAALAGPAWRATSTKPAVLDCPRRPDEIANNEIALSDDGRMLAVHCGDGDILVWRAGSRHVAGRIDGSGPTAINRDATLVAVSPSPNDVRLWDPAVNRVVQTVDGESGRHDHVRFSPDGRLLAVADEDGTIRVWTIASDDDPVVLTGTVGQTRAISFSPDGKLIAAAGTDNVMRLWNTDGSGEPLTFDHPADARQLAFSADGRQLITLYGATIRFTPCEVCGPIDEVLALAGQRTTRDFTPEERAKYLRQPG